ncbi:hypothetical protein C8Q78DRAFT_985916 [Trametes maxima]|nr:hypothetical protein C8Q78DRAFT_985916 [Trametes maxima]
MKVFLWVLKECKAVDVPTFRALRNFQTEAARRIGFQTTRHTTMLNNEYYANRPAELFRLNLSNPLVRPQMCLYPEVCGPVAEFFHSQKMLEMDEKTLDLAQLMWADWKHAPQRHFYIKELAQLRDDRFVIPLRWVTVRGTESFDGLEVFCDEDKVFRIWTDRMIRESAQELKRNCLDLQAHGHKLIFSEESPEWTACMLHKARAIANGRPMITMRMMPWSDDVSGNRTKQYNAHTNVYVANANLPHTKLQQEYFIQFVSTSQYASSSEQMRIVVENTGPDRWYTAYDCVLEQEVVFRIIPHILPADNPQQAEDCSHVTGKGNYPCRRCKVGGTATECEQDKNYEQFFTGADPRTVEETVRDIREQLFTACLGVQDGVDALQTKTGVKDKIAQYWIEQLIDKARSEQQIRLNDPIRKDTRLRDPHLKGDGRKAVKDAIKKEIQQELFSWLICQPVDTFESLPESSPLRSDLRPGDHYNALLAVPSLDVHRDTPCEILHTYLLGADKYAWHKTNSEWDKKKEQLFSIRLRASSIDGLALTSVLGDYITRYPNSLLGKHFKIIQQLAVFELYDNVCPPLVFDLWKATGELGAMLWFHKITDLEAYLNDLTVYVANLLDIWATIDPTRIIVKQKLHVLSHLVEDVRRHGPAVLYSTEIFECWNTIFRHCSIHSNHHGASHDISRTLADVERFKHQVSGGWWNDEPETSENGRSQPAVNPCALGPSPQSSRTYVQAGELVRNFLVNHPELQRRLGWVDPVLLTPGDVKHQTSKNKYPSLWSTACGNGNVLPPPAGGHNSEEDIWLRCRHVVSQSLDICREGSFVFFRSGNGSENSVNAGRIHRILCRKRDGKTIIILDQYSVNEERDPYFNMPILYRATTSAGSPACCSVNPKCILFHFNTQHDCRHAKCTDLVDEPIVQERQVTSLMRKALVHNPIDRFLINMHALHNAALIREVLPRNLTQPIPYLADRVARHRDIAAGLRISGPIRRAQTQAKAAETRARKKELKAKDATSNSTASAEG